VISYLQFARRSGSTEGKIAHRRVQEKKARGAKERREDNYLDVNEKSREGLHFKNLRGGKVRKTANQRSKRGGGVPERCGGILRQHGFCRRTISKAASADEA